MVHIFLSLSSTAICSLNYTEIWLNMLLLLVKVYLYESTNSSVIDRWSTLTSSSSDLNKNTQKSLLETWISSCSLEMQLDTRTRSSIKIIFLNTNRGMEKLTIPVHCVTQGRKISWSLIQVTSQAVFIVSGCLNYL